MELKGMIKKLSGLEGWYKPGDSPKVFLVALDDEPVDRGRDRDIWSLVGPVTLVEGPSRFELVEGGSLKAVEHKLELAEKTVQPGDGQQLFILVCTPEGEGTPVEEGRDRDIWSLTGTLLPESMVGRFLELQCPRCEAASREEREGQDDAAGITESAPDIGRSASRPVGTRHLLISLQSVN